MITVAALSPSLDITYLVDRLELGAIHRPSAVYRVAGGKSFNLARAAATLGATVETIAVLGGSTGDFLTDELHAAGIGVRTVSSPAETRTCVSIAAADRSDLTELYPHAAQIPGPVWQQFRTALAEHLSQPDPVGGWLAINGGAPQGLDADAYAELIALAHRVGVRVAVDTHGPALTAAIAAGPDLIKVNRYEAAEFLGRTAEDDLPSMITAITERTSGAAIITDGRAGAVSSTATGTVRATLPADIDGRYPVGSGDSFLGGWLAAADHGADAAESLRLASGCGAANALQPGPGILDPEIARDIASRTVLSELP